MSSITTITKHLQKVAATNKKKGCSLSIGSKIKINSCNLLHKQILFTLPVVFSGKGIDDVVCYSSDVLVSFRKEYFEQKLPYKIENGLSVSGDLETIESTEIVKGETVLKYNLKIQLTLQ